MELKVNRVAKKATYTIGHLSVDGVRMCDTLEDADRGLKQSMSIAEIVRKKIYGKTAIPAGRYEVRMDMASPKYVNKAKTDYFWKPYCSNMPRIMNVKGYDGVLIHAGTTDADTLGCLLVGENSVIGKLTNSRKTFAMLWQKMYEAHKKGDKIYLTIG